MGGFYGARNIPALASYSSDVLDDGSITLQTIANNATGFIVAGNDDERAQFTVNSTGTVNLIMASSNVVANADTDAKLCIGTAASQDPLVIKNRLGSTKRLVVSYWYN